jgi:hypothetical protein
MNTPLVPISWGELFDKVTILEIKLDKITSQKAKANVERKFEALNLIFIDGCNQNLKALDLVRDLRKVNLTLWDIEDCIRAKEKRNTFDSEFIQYARDVYITNDKRSKIKKQINEIFGSELTEEKSYSEY